jgi:hypothetical protein
MLKLQQAREKLRRRQRGLEFGHAIDVPRLAIVRHGLAAVPSGTAANPDVRPLQSAQRRFQRRPRLSESPTRQVATEAKNDHVRALPPVGLPAADGLR